MQNSPQRRTISRSTLVKHIQTILRDGRPRTGQQIATALRQYDIRVAPALVVKVLTEADGTLFVYDSRAFTYTLAQPAATEMDSRPDQTTAPVAQVVPQFTLRQRVRLVADPSRRGRIVDGPRQYGERFEYCVIVGDDEGWFAEADLEPVPLDGLPRWQTRDEFLRDLLLAKVRGQLTDSLYAYQASRTQFVPYQFRPALKFLRNPDQRILIADEVGLGKTIEAAIIYLELKARLNINRVLVLCPSRLKAKWQDELRNRFEEEFVELDAPKLRTFLDDTRRMGSRIPFKAIASFEMMRSAAFIEAWTEHYIPLDLLIVDEAHYMRNQDTRTYQLGTALTDSADAVVFLTATPLHLGNRDLYNLLHLLAPGEYNDPSLFEAQVAPNSAIIRASQYVAANNPRQAEQTLRQVEQTVLRDRFLKNPYYHDVLDRLREGVGTDRERILLQRELLELNTLSNLFTRTRKREVTNAAVRAAYTIRVELTPVERRFYEAVLEDVRQELTGRRGAQSFATIMKERQAASCLAAMREAVEETERRRSPTYLQVERSAFELLDDTEQQLHTPSHVHMLARQSSGVDSKFALFEQTLRDALTATPDSKVLVFSFFRRTLAYLQRCLRSQGYVVDVLNGDVPVPDRKQIIERFRADPSIRVLLSSEVGAEGLDFQFCDILVNYDLPWNPMQVEQRIGRLDRFGQQAEKIRIYNFYIAETIETRIFQRLYDRIGIFERSIGDLEAILGEEIKQLSEAVLRPSLTPQEQEQLAEDAARRILRHQIEADELEHQKDQLLGQEAIFNQQIHETVTSGRVIAADEVRALISTFLAESFPRAQFMPDGDEACWSLRLTPDLTALLEQLLLRENREQTLYLRFTEAMRGNGVVVLTFESDLARKRPLLEFVTMRHPLARVAVEYWQHKAAGGVPATSVVIHGPPTEVGDGYFFIYQLTLNGAQPQYTLQPMIALDDGRLALETAETLLSALQHAQEADVSGATAELFSAAQQRTDREMAQQRDARKQEAVRRNQALVAAQKASIRTSFEAKIDRAREQSHLAQDARIERMKLSQIRNLQANMESKLAALEQKMKVSVSYTLIAGGRVRILPRVETRAATPAPAILAMPQPSLTSIPKPPVLTVPVQQRPPVVSDDGAPVFPRERPPRSYRPPAPREPQMRTSVEERPERSEAEQVAAEHAPSPNDSLVSKARRWLSDLLGKR